MSTEVVLEKVILSYPHLVTPWAGRQNQQASYNCAFIIPSTFTQWPQIQEAANEAVTGFFGASVPENLKMPWLNKFLQPQVVKADQPYAGCYVMNAKDNNYKPEVVDQNIQPIPDMRVKAELWPGCIVNALVNFYAFNNSGNMGVGLGLKKVQLVDNTSEGLIRLGGDQKEASEVFKAVPGAPPATAPAGPVAPGVPGGQQAPW